MLTITIPTQEVLYLGGNADLAVVVDTCDDRVELVSARLTRLDVIERVGR